MTDDEQISDLPNLTCHICGGPFRDCTAAMCYTKDDRVGGEWWVTKLEQPAKDFVYP